MFEHHDPYPADPSSADDPDAIGADVTDTSEPEPDALVGLDLWPHEGTFGEPADTDPAGTEPVDAPEVRVPGADGTEFTGTATYDADGDGNPDTVVVRTADGTVISATDADGDGVADRLVVLGVDGHTTVSELGPDGNWVVVDPGAHPSGHGDTDPDTTGTDSTEPETPATIPAGHIAAAGEHGDIDAGAPQYDLNGDGKPETAVVERDGVMYQYSDIDGDGRADQLLQVTMADRTATIMVDQGDGWTVAVHGHIAEDGDFVPDSDPAPDSGPVPAAGSGTGGPDPHPEPAGHRSGHDQPVAEPQHRAPDIELTTPNGQRVDVGAPDQDLDGDGVAESVAVRTDDGRLLIVSDTDADGTADGLIDVDPATGEANWLTVEPDGSWVVTHQGHVTADGSLVVDDAGAPRADEQVTVSVDGRSFPAGPATIDSDHDGVADTVAVPGVGGSTQFYQDTDGDGIADRAWTVNADGTHGPEYTIDASGEWVQARAEQHPQTPGPADRSDRPEPQLHTPWGSDR